MPLPKTIEDREFRKFTDGLPTFSFDYETRGRQMVAPSGAVVVGELIRLCGGNFEGGVLLPNLWRTAFTGTGTAPILGGELEAQTGVTANSRSAVQAFQRARFVTATYNIAHLAIQTPGWDNPNVIRRWGMFDPVQPVAPGLSGDGVYFENNSGQIFICRMKSGVVVEQVPEANFNGEIIKGDRDGAFIKDDNLKVYEIIYNAGSAFFFQNRKLIHRLTSLDSAAYETVHLGLGLEVKNINGNTTNNIISTRGFSCSRIGSGLGQPNRQLLITSGSGLLKNSPGRLRRIIITKTGTAGADIILYDNNAAGAGGTKIQEIDLTETLIELTFDFDFDLGLSYVATGNGFEVQVVFD